MVDTFRLPKSPELTTVPSVLALIYFTTYSDLPIFAKLRSNLPAWFERVWPILFYVHIAESALAGFRSVRAGKSAGETVKWMAATMIWGFGSLGQQKKALGL